MKSLDPSLKTKLNGWPCDFSVRLNDKLLEIRIVYIYIRVVTYLLQHLLNLGDLDRPTLPLKCLYQRVLVDPARLKDVKVVEELPDVVRVAQLFGCQCRCQELRIRDVLVALQSKLLHESFDVSDCQVDLGEVLVDLMDSFQHLLLANRT